MRSSLLCCCFAILAVSAGEVPIVEVDVVDGQRHGDLKVRDADGMIRVRGEYARGEPVGRVSAYGEDGLLEWRAEYPRTRAEVLAGMERLWIAEPIPLSYEREVVTGPDEFAVAEIPDAQYDQALRLTNFYRFVAGVPHDVEIDEDYNDACAHGATVLASLGGISHRPPRPEGMDRDFYRRGYDACSKSNLQGAFLRYLAVMVHFFMWDGDATNARKVGHRRWVINPTMKKVGFGAAGQIGLMYAVDKSRLHRWDWVSWPGRGWQPLRLFPAKLPWSIHLNRDRYRVPGENEIEVVVERLDANYRPVEEVGFDFVAVEEGFGTTNIAIVFRPRIDRELLRAARARDPDLDWHGLDAGELRYAVHLSGLRPRRRGIEIDQVDYLVHFFPWEAPGDGERRPGEEGVVAVGEEDRPGEKAGGDGEAEAEAGDDDAPVELGLGERESLLWQALNRFRADPGADARRLRPPTSHLLPGLGHEVDWELFLDEVRTLDPAPPLMLHADLLGAARAHARYMAANRELGHDEVAGREGFTGAEPGARSRAAGWKHGAVAENVTGPTYGIRNAHASFIVDWGRGPDDGDGGMQEGRGHRRACARPAYTHVGLGVVEHPTDPERLWVCQVFGRSEERVRAAGVVFVDHDRDGLGDASEAIAGAEVVLRDVSARIVARTRTDSLGLWSIRVPAGESPASIGIERPGEDGAPAQRREMAWNGTGPAWWAAGLPPAADRRRMVALLEEYEAVAEEGGSAARRANDRRRLEILFAARGVDFAPQLRARIAAALGDLDPDEDPRPTMAELLNAYDRGEGRRAGRDAKQQVWRWRDTAAQVWLNDFQRLCECFELADDFLEAAHRGGRYRERDRRRLEALRAGLRGLVDPDLGRRARALDRACAAVRTTIRRE